MKMYEEFYSKEVISANYRYGFTSGRIKALPFDDFKAAVSDMKENELFPQSIKDKYNDFFHSSGAVAIDFEDSRFDKKLTEVMLEICDKYKDYNGAAFMFLPFFVSLNCFTLEERQFLADKYGNNAEYYSNKSISVLNIVLSFKKEKSDYEPTILPVFLQKVTGFRNGEIVLDIHIAEEEDEDYEEFKLE